MPGPSTCLAAAALALACAARADTIKIAATSSYTFDPNSVTAKQGDVLEFHFQSQNHSVVSGSYQFPCSPMQLGSGFYSGFVPVESGEPGKVFRVSVSSTEPMPFYSSQATECSAGMVGIINPSGKQTLDDYKARAARLSRAVTPGSNSYGGQLVDENDLGDKKGAAAAATVPLGVAAALAVAVLMA